MYFIRESYDTSLFQQLLNDLNLQMFPNGFVVQLNFCSLINN